MLQNADSEWSVTVHRDLEGVLEIWRSRPFADAVGVLHIGFDRPPSRAFDEVASLYSGRMLVTSSAKFALPAGFLTTNNPVGQAAHLPIYLAIRGWGYELNDEVTEVSNSTSRDDTVRFSDWVRAFVISYPNAEESLRELGIGNEKSYLVNEASLPHNVRCAAAIFRCNQLCQDRSDPCALAAAVPPWLQMRSISSLDVTVRISNVFKIIGVKKVDDLATLTVDDLLKTQNFGRKSVRDLAQALESALQRGPSDHGAGSERAALGFIDSIEEGLQAYSDRDRDVVRRRMGLEGAAETLQEIGDRYGVSRERIRQIEAKIVDRMVLTDRWPDVLATKLQALLSSREVPMPLLGIEAADSWFSGVGRARDTLRYALINICQSKAGSIVSANGVEYVALMSQERWEQAINEARKLLEGAADREWSEERCRQIVGALLPATAAEFRGLLWEEAKRYCHFVVNELGERVLRTYGRGVEAIVEAILLEADQPLHFTEIASRASRKSDRDIDVRRAHSAAANVALLFDRGTFGLEKHLPLGADGLSALAAEAEDLVADGPADRQWHSNEILTGLLERGSKLAPHANKYVLDIALQRSAGLRRLGRMVWSREFDGDIARIDVRQAAIAILQQASGPLHINEIRQRIVALRGLNGTFQISNSDPLLRVSPGYWGLNDRDFRIKRPEQPILVERLVGTLERRGRALHISELNEALTGVLPGIVPPMQICSVALLDHRIRTNVSQYLYLAEWGGPRRQGLSETIEAVLSSSIDGLTFDDLVLKVQEVVQHTFERSTVSTCLQSMGVQLDPNTSLWSMSEKRGDGQAEDLVAENT